MGPKGDFIPMPGNARPYPWPALRRSRRHQKNPCQHHAVYWTSHSKPTPQKEHTGEVLDWG
jgi:hypothetical protein